MFTSTYYFNYQVLWTTFLRCSQSRGIQLGSSVIFLLLSCSTSFVAMSSIFSEINLPNSAQDSGNAKRFKFQNQLWATYHHCQSAAWRPPEQQGSPLGRRACAQDYWVVSSCVSVCVRVCVCLHVSSVRGGLEESNWITGNKRQERYPNVVGVRKPLPSYLTALRGIRKTLDAHQAHWYSFGLPMHVFIKRMFLFSLCVYWLDVATVTASWNNVSKYDRSICNCHSCSPLSHLLHQSQCLAMGRSVSDDMVCITN